MQRHRPRFLGSARRFLPFSLSAALVLTPFEALASVPSKAELLQKLEATHARVLARRARAMISGVTTFKQTFPKPQMRTDRIGAYEWAYAGARRLYKGTWDARVSDGKTTTSRRWDRMPPEVRLDDGAWFHLPGLDPEREAYECPFATDGSGPQRWADILPVARLTAKDDLIWLDWDKKSDWSRTHYRIGFDPSRSYIIREQYETTTYRDPRNSPFVSSMRLIALQKAGDIWLPRSVKERYGSTKSEYVIDRVSTDVPDPLFDLGQPGDTLFDHGKVYTLGPDRERGPFVHRHSRRRIPIPDDPGSSKAKGLLKFIAGLALAVSVWYAVKAVLRRRSS
ncbi:MAG TPA: hypothetical protein VMI31_09475 [Fimbriimonadaceae bacterium]|nr:hypothetical protein [Fimbriimonadaceae bacterium]